MDIKTFKNLMLEKTFNLPQIKTKLANIDEIDIFLTNNKSLLDNVYPTRVCNFLINACIKLTENKINNELVANVYNVESIKFAILCNQKEFTSIEVLHKKFAKIFLRILSESSTFTLFYKKSDMKFSRTTRIEPTYPMEFFWLIPLFKNPKVIFSLDIFTFISDNINIQKSVGDEYKNGYSYFVNNVLSFDKDNYKQFIKDGLIQSKK